MIRRLLAIALLVASLLSSAVAVERAHADSRVSVIQETLNNMGYDTGPVDGAWGRRTERAARQYLDDNNIDHSSVFGSGGADIGAILDAVMTQGAGTSGEAAQLMPQFGHNGPIYGFDVSPDGAFLASGGSDNILRIWDIPSGRLLMTLEGHQGGGGINAIKYSRDGRFIATVGSPTAKIRDARTGETLRTIDIPHGTGNTVTFSPNGSHILTAGGSSSNEEYGLYVWDVVTGRQVRRMSGHTDGVEVVIYSSDGRYIASGGVDRTVRVWAAIDGRLLQTLNGHENSVESLALSPDGGNLASGSADRSIKIWKLETGELLSTFDTNYNWIMSLDYAPDGSKILAGTFSGKHLLFDADTGHLIKGSPERHESWVTEVQFASDGESYFVSSWDSKLQQWTANLSSRVQNFEGRVVGVVASAYAPDGSYVVTGGYDGAVKVWDASTGSLLRIIGDGSTGWVSNAFSLSRDGSLVASATATDRFTVWRVGSGEVVREFQTDATTISSISFSSDSTLVAAGTVSYTADNAIAVWNLADGERVHTLQSPNNGILSATFSPDGGSLVQTSFDKSIKVWDLGTGRIVRDLVGHTRAVLSAAYSPDGSQIVSTSADRTIKVWNARSGNLIFTMAEHTDHVQFAAFSPDGKKIVSSSADTTVKIWDLRTRTARTLRGHLSIVDSAVFSPSGKYILSGSYDGTTRVWSALNGELLATNINLGGVSWLTVTPQGFFDERAAGSENAHVARALTAISIGRFYQALYRPDLVREALAGDPHNLVSQAARGVNLDAIIDGGDAPALEILSPEPGRRAEADGVGVEASVTDTGGGVGRIEWKINGTTVGLGERGLGRIEEGAQASGRVLQLSRTVLLEPGDNIIEIVAYNEANLIASEPVSVTVTWDGVSGAAPPDLHVMAVGVNNYFDNQLRLNYAVPDARALADAFRQAGPGLYDEIHVHTLFDEDVTVAGLAAAFDDLSGKVSPRDVFVFFIAGHGKTVDGRYYFLPQDFRYRNAESIVSDGIGQDQWQAWFAQVQARKSVLLYDTCESGSLTGDRIAERGLGRLTAMDKLTRAMGRTVLSAATDDAPALEGYRGHGVFTYALLEAMHEADGNNNERIEVTELAAHIDDRVPAISHSAFGVRQIPQMRIVGSNFPIGVRLASVDTGAEAEPETPREPTHILTLATEVLDVPGEGAGQVSRLDAWTVVRVLEDDGTFALIARDGVKLGYVPSGSLRRMQ